MTPATVERPAFHVAGIAVQADLELYDVRTPDRVEIHLRVK